MVHVSSPGKLMIAGEWAVLEPGNPCIVTAIGKRVHVSLEKSQGFSVEMADIGISFEGEMKERRFMIKTPIGEDGFEKARFAISAIETSLQYLEEKGKSISGLKARIWKDDIQHEELRTGFGYFASLIVSMTTAILHEAGMDVSKNRDVIFRLSSIAYYRTRGRGGSAYNIAAAVYGKTLVYRRFDGEWLKAELDDVESGSKRISYLAESPWPGFFAKDISVPKETQICIGIIGDPVSARSTVRQMESYKKSRAMEYDSIISHMKNNTEQMIVSFANRDLPGILELVRKSQSVLTELGQKSGVEAETPKLRRLCWIASRHSGAGKLSGAGKSDVGIAICFDRGCSEKIKNEWKESGISSVETSFGTDGVKVE